MRDGAYSALTSAPPRRTAVKGCEGVYERTDHRGRRRLEVDYYDHTGRRRWKSLPPGTSQKEAKTVRARLHVRRAEGERFAPTKVPSLGEFFEEWLADRDLRPRTREKYTWAFDRHIIPRLGTAKISAIDSEDIASLAHSLRRAKPGGKNGLSDASIVAVLSPLSRVLQTAARRKLRTGNPVREFLNDREHEDRPRVAKSTHAVLTATEVAELVEAAPDEHSALVATLAWTGMRASETLALRWEDIDLDGREIHIGAQLDRKTRARVALKTENSDRYVPISNDLARVLAAHKLARPKWLKTPESFVFSTRSGRPLDHRAISRRALDPAAKKAKLAHVGPHQLRHGFGSLLHDSGVPIAHISALLGHADEAFTVPHLRPPCRWPRRAEARARIAGGSVRSSSRRGGVRARELRRVRDSPRATVALGMDSIRRSLHLENRASHQHDAPAKAESGTNLER